MTEDLSSIHRHRLPPSERGRTQDASRDDLIIEATLSLLREGGYHSLTMTDVAARAGVSKATLYRRWTAKADLVADAVATLAPLVPPDYPGTGLRDDLIALMEQAGDCAGRPDIVNATMAMAWSSPDLFHTLRERFVSYIRNEIAVLANGLAARGLPSLTNTDAMAIGDTVVALLTYYSDSKAAPVPRDRLIQIVDRVLIVLMTGSRRRN